MRVSVLYLGHEIGVTELDITPMFASGTLETFPAYDAIRPILRDASRATRNMGYLPPGNGSVGGIDAAGDAAGQRAFALASEVCGAIELHDDQGHTVSTNWIELVDWDDDTDVCLIAELPDAEASVGARLPPRSTRVLRRDDPTSRSPMSECRVRPNEWWAPRSRRGFRRPLRRSLHP
jgi:hypothetical protein